MKPEKHNPIAIETSTRSDKVDILNISLPVAWLAMGIFVLIAVIMFTWGTTIPPISAVDDAYITFRYAANFSQDVGLRFNTNEWVFGTTTPLFTLLLGMLGFVTADIPFLGHWIGIIAWICAVGAAMGWLWQVGYRIGAVMAGFLLTFQATMIHSIGMETPLLLVLMLASGWAWWAKCPRWAVPLSALLILTRADSTLWVLFAGLEYWRTTRRLPWREGLSVIALCLPWFLFSWWRYGSVLPNSISAKVGQNAAMAVGGEIPFVLMFKNWVSAGNSELWLAIVVGLALLGVLTIIWRERTLWWVIGWWVLYMIIYHLLSVAGFTWYFVPPIEIFYFVVALGIGSIARWQVRQPDTSPFRVNRMLSRYSGMAIATVLFSLVLSGLIRPVQEAHRYRIEGYQSGRIRDYFHLGEWLNRESHPDATVAAIEIGIIGYYSERNLVDTMGLVSPAMRDHLTGWSDTLVYAVTHFWPTYFVAVRNTAADSLITEWWFDDYYQPVLELPELTLYQRTSQPADIAYQIDTNVRYNTGMMLNQIWVDTQTPQRDEALKLWLSLTTGIEHSENYQITTYLVNTVTFERFALENTTPYANLYPSTHWLDNDTLFIPIRINIPDTLPDGTYQPGITFFDIDRQRALERIDTPGAEATVQAGWVRIGDPSMPREPETLLMQGTSYVWEDSIALSRIGTPPTIHTTDREIPIYLEWQIHQPTTRNLTFFVHLIDASGAIVTQLDRRPFDGTFPTSVWQPEEELADLYILPLPTPLPSGEYRLRIGFYDESGSMLLSAPDNVKVQDHILLETPLLVQ